MLYSQVVQAIGASEGEVLKLLTGAAAREVDGDGAINIVNAAKSVGVTQYLMVTSMGTGKFGWPAGNSMQLALPNSHAPTCNSHWPIVTCHAHCRRVSRKLAAPSQQGCESRAWNALMRYAMLPACLKACLKASASDFSLSAGG